MSTDTINNLLAKGVQHTSVSNKQHVEQSSPRQNSVTTNGNTVPLEEASSQKPSMDELTEAVEQLNDHVQTIKRDLHFSIDDASGDTVIRVVNSETEELVRQIPSEEVLRMSQTIKEQTDSLSGLILEISA